MKKSVCLMAILGALGATSAFAASSTQSVEINFTGEVIDKACEITLHNGGNTLDLGTIRTDIKDGQKGSIVPVVFKFMNCKTVGVDTDAGLKVENVQLVADLNDTNFPQTALNNGTLSTSVDGVLVQIYKDSAGNTEGLKGKDDLGIQQVGNAQYATIGYAAMKKEAAKQISAGKLTAKAMFKVTYQ